MTTYTCENEFCEKKWTMGERDLSGIFCPYCGKYQDKDSSFKGVNEIKKVQ